MATTLTQEQIEKAKKWYKHYNIDVTPTDFETGNVLSVVLGDSDFSLELSNDEVSYRAELWDELEIDEDEE